MNEDLSEQTEITLKELKFSIRNRQPQRFEACVRDMFELMHKRIKALEDIEEERDFNNL